MNFCNLTSSGQNYGPGAIFLSSVKYAIFFFGFLEIKIRSVNPVSCVRAKECDLKAVGGGYRAPFDLI